MPSQTDTTSSDRKKKRAANGSQPSGEAAPAWLAPLLLLYFLATLAGSALVVARSWPGNPFYRPIYSVERQRNAILHLTTESIDRIDHALTLLGRLPGDPDNSALSQADCDNLATTVAFAQAIVATSAPNESLPPPPPANARAWSAADVANVLNQHFRKAHLILERRFEILATPVHSPTLRGVLGGLVFAPKLPAVALTASETARLATLLAADDSAASSPPAASNPGSSGKAPIPPSQLSPSVSLDGLRQLDFIILLAALGAAGASTQCLASLASYLGARRFASHWTAFYITRPWIGAVLGPVFYLILRGGLMTQQANWNDVNKVGYAAVAILVGFCSSEAMENLRDIAKAFFRGKQEKENLASAAPHIVSARRTADSSLSDTHALLVEGDGFAADAQVLLNGRTSTGNLIRSADTLHLILGSGNFGPLSVQVLNPGATPSVSNAIMVPSADSCPTVMAARIEPATAGQSQAQLHLEGQNLTKDTRVFVAGNALTPVTEAEAGKIQAPLGTYALPLTVRVVNTVPLPAFAETVIPKPAA